MPIIKGFVSHAFSDSAYASGIASFREAIQKLTAKVEALLSNSDSDLTIKLYFEASDLGRPLPEQLRQQLRESDFIIADISSQSFGDQRLVNENVMYEVGYAMASNLPLILFGSNPPKPPIGHQRYLGLQLQ